MGTWHAICSQYAAHLSLVNVMFNLEITYDCTATQTEKGSSSINSELFFSDESDQVILSSVEIVGRDRVR